MFVLESNCDSDVIVKYVKVIYWIVLIDCIYKLEFFCFFFEKFICLV